MPQVKYYNKTTGVTYIYDSVSYYDPEKKQSRAKRKLLGKLDPETGEIVPCGSKGRPKKAKENMPDDETDYRELYDEECRRTASKEREIERLKDKISSLDDRILSLEQTHRNDLRKIEAYRKKLAAIADMANTDPD